MLKQLRDQGASVVVKVLMGLLVLSFAAWGIGDIFSPNSAGQPVATAGDTEVSQQEFLAGVRNQQSMLRARGFNEDMLANVNLSAIVVDQLVSRAVYEEEARKLSLVATKDVIARTIRDTREFQDSAGNFDRRRYDFALSNQGYSPAYFELLVSKDVVSNMLLDSVSAGVKASDAETKAIYTFQKETRDLSFVKVPLDETEVIPAPSDEALTAFYDNNQERFRAPDYRKISYISIDPDMLAESVEISDTDVLAAYESRLEEFSVAEQRNVQQMLLPDQATAAAAREEVLNGKSFAAVALEIASQEEDAINLGTMTKAEMPDDTLGNVAFALGVNEVSEPVEGLFGWYLLNVKEIVEGSVKPLADVDADIRKELARETAVSEAYDLSNALDDTIAGGATLEEAADQTGLKLVTIDAIDQNGADETGTYRTDLPNPASFLKFAYETEEGLDSLMQDDGADGFFILRVDGVTPSRIKSLDEVKSEAITLWDMEERRIKAQAQADALVEKLNAGDKLASLMPADVKEAVAVVRPSSSTQHSDIPNAVLSTIFDLEIGKAAAGYAGNTYVIAQVNNVTIPTMSSDAVAAEEIKQAVLAGMSADLITQFNLALRDRHSVTVNQGLITHLTSEQY